MASLFTNIILDKTIAIILWKVYDESKINKYLSCVIIYFYGLNLSQQENTKLHTKFEDLWKLCSNKNTIQI